MLHEGDSGADWYIGGCHQGEIVSSENCAAEKVPCEGIPNCAHAEGRVRSRDIADRCSINRVTRCHANGSVDFSGLNRVRGKVEEEVDGNNHNQGRHAYSL